MKDQLRSDLARLEGLAFARVSGCAEFLQRFHEMPGTESGDVDRELLQKVYRWAFVPLSLWPEDLRGFGMYVLGCIEAGRELDPAAKAMARLLPEAPGEDVCGPIAE